MENFICVLVLLGHILVVGASECNLLKPGAISFETADITVSIQTAGGGRVAQAFNATTGALPPHKMRWVSLGVPRLLVRTIAQNSSAGGSANSSKPKPTPFEFAPGGFYVYIETLSSSVAAELAKEASVKYERRIEASQFLPIDKHIVRFTCSIDLWDTDEKFTRLDGEAKVIGNPVVVFFRKRNASENLIKNYHSQLIIQCNIESSARKLKSDTYTSSLHSSTLGKSNARSLSYSEISGQISKPTQEEVYSEIISLSTEDYRVADILIEGYELARRSLTQEVQVFKDDLNKSMQQLQQGYESARRSLTQEVLVFKDDLNKSMMRQIQQSISKPCGSAKFDLNRSSREFTYSADRKTITRSGSGWRGAYVEGFLSQTGKSELCIRATKSPGGSNMDGVMFGLASDGVPLGEHTNANQILIYLVTGEYFGGAANRNGVSAAGAANENDLLKAVYDADANTLAFYRNWNAWGPTLPLNQNAIANKANLMFFVTVYFSGQSVTLA